MCSSYSLGSPHVFHAFTGIHFHHSLCFVLLRPPLPFLCPPRRPSYSMFPHPRPYSHSTGGASVRRHPLFNHHGDGVWHHHGAQLRAGRAHAAPQFPRHVYRKQRRRTEHDAHQQVAGDDQVPVGYQRGSAQRGGRGPLRASDAPPE